VLKANVMQAGYTPCFVVTSLEAPTPQRLYEDLYDAHGNCERTLAWLNQFRRLSKDYERLLKRSEAMIYLSMTRLMSGITPPLS
jgi:hypothetical protein